MNGPLVVALGALLAAATACGGADVPSHSGYSSAKARPWQNPTVLLLDEDGEAEVDDAVSYPKRERAKWYAVDLESPGELEVKLSVPALVDDRVIDLAFEVIGEDYQVIAKADEEEDDAGDEVKSRLIGGIGPGRHYVHVFAQRRLDEAEFNLQVAFKPTASEVESDFPAKVAFISALPDVPKVDDAERPPAPEPPKRRPKRRATPPPDAPLPKAIRARVAAIVKVTAGGTEIRIDRGSAQGIAEGWTGTVVDKSGKAISGGAFSIKRVTQAESFATVRATADAVTSAKYVRLRPP